MDGQFVFVKYVYWEKENKYSYILGWVATNKLSKIGRNEYRKLKAKLITHFSPTKRKENELR
jgi:hypothetical protein